MSTPLLDAAYSPPGAAQWLFGMAGVVAVLFLLVHWTRNQVGQVPKLARRAWNLLPFSKAGATNDHSETSRAPMTSLGSGYGK